MLFILKETLISVAFLSEDGLLLLQNGGSEKLAERDKNSLVWDLNPQFNRGTTESFQLRKVMSTEIRVEELWQIFCNYQRQQASWKAKEILRTIITLRPDHASARAALASLLIDDGEIDAAMLQASFAYQLNPGIPDLSRKLADLYFISGLYDKAGDLYQEAIRTGDQDRVTAERLVLCKNIAETKISLDDEH